MNSFRENHKYLKKKKKINIKITAKIRREKHGTFTEENNEISWSANNDKRIQLIDWIKTYAYWTNKDLVCKNEELIVTI